MNSTLFTELNVNEEANLSGGSNSSKKKVVIVKSFNDQKAFGGFASSGINVNKGDDGVNNTSADASNNIS